jgi:hypothetical protein
MNPPGLRCNPTPDWHDGKRRGSFSEVDSDSLDLVLVASWLPEASAVSRIWRVGRVDQRTQIGRDAEHRQLRYERRLTACGVSTSREWIVSDHHFSLEGDHVLGYRTSS